MERELLQPETKLELVLTAYEDLEKLANEVRQIKSLEHVVTGADFEGKRRDKGGGTSGLVWKEGTYSSPMAIPLLFEQPWKSLHHNSHLWNLLTANKQDCWPISLHVSLKLWTITMAPYPFFFHWSMIYLPPLELSVVWHILNLLSFFLWLQ